MKLGGTVSAAFHRDMAAAYGVALPRYMQTRAAFRMLMLLLRDFPDLAAAFIDNPAPSVGEARTLMDLIKAREKGLSVPVFKSLLADFLQGRLGRRELSLRLSSLRETGDDPFSEMKEAFGNALGATSLRWISEDLPGVFGVFDAVALVFRRTQVLIYAVRFQDEKGSRVESRMALTVSSAQSAFYQSHVIDGLWIVTADDGDDTDDYPTEFGVMQYKNGICKPIREPKARDEGKPHPDSIVMKRLLLIGRKT